MSTFHNGNSIEEVALAETTGKMRLKEFGWYTMIWRHPF